MKTIIQFIGLVCFFVMLCSVIPHLPVRGDVDAPLHRKTSPAGSPVAGYYYVKNGYEDAHTLNAVTVVLGDYRGFDTLGETIVVFTAGAACLLILGRRRKS